PENERSAVMACVEPVEQGRPGAADVQVSGGAWREADANEGGAHGTFIVPPAAGLSGRRRRAPGWRPRAPAWRRLGGDGRWRAWRGAGGGGAAHSGPRCYEPSARSPAQSALAPLPPAPSPACRRPPVAGGGPLPYR